MTKKVVCFNSYKQKLEEEKAYKVKCVKQYEALNSEPAKSCHNIVKAHDQYSREALLNLIGRLEARHKYDIEFINLLDLFMEKECPQYGPKFDRFLDNINKSL